MNTDTSTDQQPATATDQRPAPAAPLLVDTDQTPPAGLSVEDAARWQNMTRRRAELLAAREKADTELREIARLQGELRR